MKLDTIRAWNESVLLHWPHLVDAHARELQAHQCIALLLQMLPPGAEVPSLLQPGMPDLQEVPGAAQPIVSVAAVLQEVGHSADGSRRRSVRKRATGGPGAHSCHGGCGKVVPPAMWGCRDCWRRLPLGLRNLIFHHYRPGQEIDKRPSAEYVCVARQVQDYIRENWPERAAS